MPKSHELAQMQFSTTKYIGIGAVPLAVNPEKYKYAFEESKEIDTKFY